MVKLLKRPGAYLRLLGAYMRVNWHGALEYRTNFVFDTILSALELGMYLFYWNVFLDISGGIRGVTFAQLAALVAFNHVIYATAETLIGNQIWDAVETIVKGYLDIFLVQPKSTIFQLFFSGARPIGLVQVLTGTILYFAILPPTPGNIAAFAFGLATGASIFISWVIAVQSLTFRLGNASVVYRLVAIILHFAKKPARIFSIGVRVILYTIVPAVYIGGVQAELLSGQRLPVVALLLALGVVSPVIAVLVFRSGMKLYESGNLIGVRV